MLRVVTGLTPEHVTRTGVVVANGMMILTWRTIHEISADVDTLARVETLRSVHIFDDNLYSPTSGSYVYSKQNKH